MVKDVTKIGTGIVVAGLGGMTIMKTRDKDRQLICMMPAALGAVTFIDGLVSLLSDIGEIGNGITAGRAVGSKKNLKELTKRTEALEKNANVTDSKAIEK